MKQKWYWGVLFGLFLLLVAASIFPTVSSKAAITKEGVVDVPSALVKSVPSTNAKTIGKLKNGQKIQVIKQTKSGWAEFMYQKKKAYVSSKHIRFYQKVSLATVKKITDRVTNLQAGIMDKKWTENQIRKAMDPGFTKEYIDKYMALTRMAVGKDKKGNIIYGKNEKDSTDFYIEPFDWYLKVSKKEPVATYYTKEGTDYLKVSQYNPENALYLPHWKNLYMIKKPNSDWKVYNVSFNL
ncbi:SH3 domain-containing protein [Bacillus sp. 1P06AnD]|uniref:SH3 domain-containing protein n=1 Tax=Bacillus sp. 1P06AnD TaxID=3132208 RepID=UPI0039A09EA7